MTPRSPRTFDDALLQAKIFDDTFHAEIFADSRQLFVFADAFRIRWHSQAQLLYTNSLTHLQKLLYINSLTHLQKFLYTNSLTHIHTYSVSHSAIINTHSSSSNEHAQALKTLPKHSKALTPRPQHIFKHLHTLARLTYTPARYAAYSRLLLTHSASLPTLHAPLQYLSTTFETVLPLAFHPYTKWLSQKHLLPHLLPQNQWDKTCLIFSMKTTT